MLVYFTSLWSLFYFLDGIIWSTKDWNNVVLFFFFFIIWAFCVVPKKPLPNWWLLRFTSVFSSRSFIFVVLTFKSMTNFELFSFSHIVLYYTVIVCIWLEVRSHYIHLHVVIQLLQQHLLRWLFFSPFNFLFLLFKNKLTICL